ncbi:Metalloendopeptidase OMA1 [Durusdinium trenchii]|uniref:Mitochondrial (Metalloprotease-related protein 1) (MPRP-1) (Overlapping with the m-AAA protease 1 homolog) n=1 Tax=Durusdinium trenchii TaxID=1381693 RepID=A0ABP0SIS8_9DINO
MWITRRVDGESGEATRSQEKDLETLQRAQKRLQGWSDHGFLVVDVNTPNAFVTPMLPRMVFVHRGIFWVDGLARPEGLQVGKEVYVRRDGWQRAKLVSQHQDQWAAILGDSETVTVGPEDMRVRERRQLVENDEQLAMLLGHELAHAVHDHGYESLGIWTTAYSLELVLLSILDPSGMFIFLLELAAGAIARYAFVLPLGRCDEMEADATGLQICARAGYDPRLATEFMERFASFQDDRSPTWASTHPSTEGRIKALKDAEADAIKCFQEHQALSVGHGWWPSNYKGFKDGDV